MNNIKSMVFSLRKNGIVPLLLVVGIGFTFLREVVIAYYFGSIQAVEFFRIAFAAPFSMFQTLGTAIVGGLLPLILDLRRTQLDGLQRAVDKFFLVFVLIAVITIPIQIKFLAPGYAVVESVILGINMLLCWLMLPIISKILLSRLILQARSLLYVVSSTSLLFSLFFVLMLAGLQYVDVSILYNYQLAVSTLVSLLVVMYIYRIAASRVDLMAGVSDVGIETKNVNKLLLGSVIYILLMAVPRMIDRAIATGLSEGLVANIDYAMNFYVAFGVLVGTYSVLISAKDLALAKSNDRHSLLMYSRLFVVPFLASVTLAIVVYTYSNELVMAAYYRGSFSINSIIEISEILKVFIVSLPFMVVGMVASQIIVAYGAKYMVAIISIKIFAKWLSVNYFFLNGNSLFGLSALVMELVGLVLSFGLIHVLVSSNKHK